MEGIVAATSGAAEAIGLADVGRIEPGAVADLIVLDGDPLSEPAVLLDAERIRLVVQGGEILSAASHLRQGTRTE
jgi:imidazolonepropionase-like amidohydrolase